MVGMYQKQLLDAPFALNGHCVDQPRQHAPPAAASSFPPSSSSSSSGVVATSQPQAVGGPGETRRPFETLVEGILQRGAGSGNGVAAGDLEALLRWAREVAVDPCAKRPADRPRKRQVLALRRARYLRMEDVADAAELPSFSKKRKYKTHNNHSEVPRKGSMPTRKSERLAKRMNLMTSVLLTQRKKIGVGEHFQAEIPEWTGPPSDAELSCYRNDPNISKMLGNRTWPPEGEILRTDIVVAGQGRPESCSCPYPGSYFCRQHHINAARDQLRSEIGQAFTEWKFDSMGDEVSKMWSIDEQLKFNELERLVPVMENKSFWAIASKHFASKTRRDLVQYYMNVFLMRRVLSQCRLSLLEIDSDEDEVEEEEDEDQSDGSNSSQRAQDVQDVKKIS